MMLALHVGPEVSLSPLEENFAQLRFSTVLVKFT
jgi:hypothetical protein